MRQPNDIKTMTAYVSFRVAMDEEKRRLAREELAHSLAEMLRREIHAVADPVESGVYMPGEYRLRIMYTLEFEKVR